MKATMKRADLLEAIKNVKPCLGATATAFYALAAADRGLVVYTTSGDMTLLWAIKGKATGKGVALIPPSAVSTLQTVGAKDVTIQTVCKTETREVEDNHYEKSDGTRVANWDRDAKYVKATKKQDFRTWGIVLQADKTRTNCPIGDPADVQPVLPAKAYAKLTPITFKEALPFGEVAYALAGKMEQRIQIQDAALMKTSKGIDVVGTDGYRMAVASVRTKADLPAGFLVDPLAVSIMKTWKGRTTLRYRKWGDKEMTGYQLIFQNGPLTVICKSCGKYPDYARLIPTAMRKTATVRRDDLRQAVKVCTSIVGKDGTVRLVSKGRTLQVIGIAEGADTMAKIPHRGRIRQAYKASLLLDTLNRLTDTVTIWHDKAAKDPTGGEAPAVFKNGGTTLHLLMPVFVRDWERAKDEKPFTGVIEATPVSGGDRGGCEGKSNSPSDDDGDYDPALDDEGELDEVA